MIKKLSSKHVEAIIKLINQGPYFKFLYMVVKDMGIGYSIVEVDMGNKHLNPFGAIHGSCCQLPPPKFIRKA